MSLCACGHDFTDHYQTDVEYLCLLCSWCDGYTKAAANISATAPVPAGGTPEGLAREKVEMTDSEVKSSPTTEAGRELLRKARTTDGWHTNFDAGDIAAIEQQAREGGYSSGLLEGRREAVREIRAGVMAMQPEPLEEWRSAVLTILADVAGLEGEGRSPIGSNASESPPIYGMTHEDVRGCPILHGGTVCTCGLGRLAVDHLRDASKS